MAEEGAKEGRRSSAIWRRLRERVDVWRRVFLANWNLFKASRIGVVGLAIMVAFVVLALAAPFMGLRDPIRWTAPDDDLIEVDHFWATSSLPGSEFRDMPPVNQPLAFRIAATAGDARADRVYVAATNRLYALYTKPKLSEQNAWASPFNTSFDITEGTNPSRTITAPPLLMNYGDYARGPPDYEIYVGTSDGTLFFLRDTGINVPEGADNVAKISLDGSAITGLAAYTADDTADPSIIGTANLISSNDSVNWYTSVVPSSGDQGQYASLALDPAGAAYVAYYDYRNGYPTVTVLNTSVSSQWTFRQMEPPTVNVGQFTSAVYGPNGPQVAYYNQTSRTLKYATWNVNRFDTVTVDASGDVGQYASLALNESSPLRLPAIAYYNASSGSLKYAWYNGTTWATETVEGGFSGQYASLAFDALGQPHIAYFDAFNQALKHAVKVAGVWTPETVETGGVGQYASLAIDPGSDLPSVAYYNASGGGSLKYANWSGSWRTTTVDGSPGVGQYASLAFQASGNPAIAYHDARKLDLRYAAWNGTVGAWETRTIASGGNTGLYASLKFDAAGHPRVAFESYVTGRTSKDIVVAGTAAGRLYAIDVNIPKAIQPVTVINQKNARHVTRWDYRVRWQQDLGSEVHLATGPGRYISALPAFSPAFNMNGSAVFSGTRGGNLVANRTDNGGAFWPTPGFVTVGGPWNTAPIVQVAVEDVPSVKNYELVWAASGLRPNGLSLLYTRFATNGTVPPQWQVFADGAAPVGPSAGRADGGNLTQPSIEGGIAYVGSDSGFLYALRTHATPPTIPFPASILWDFSDPTLLGLHPKFQSAPLVRNNEEIILVTANEDNGTAANPLDDRGLLYSFKQNGTVSWRSTFPSVLAGTPVAWYLPSPAIGLGVIVGYGNAPYVAGVAALAASGRFLAPSEPSWAHSYACGTIEDPTRRCPGYRSGNQYWLGLDSQGRDIFSQVIWGSRIALVVGFLAAFFSVVLGVVVGLVAGYVGGKTESVLMRFTDVILVLPGLPLIIAMAAVLGASIWNIILVISLLGWPGIARIIRAEVLSLKERPFIDSARVTGASTTRIVFRHIAPNVMPLAFLYMTFAVSGAILAEAALSFIGLGDVTTMSWGIMLQLVSQSKALQAWWWLLPPGLAITLISLSFFLIGRAFDEIVNPRLRKR